MVFTNDAAYIYPPTVLLFGWTWNIGYRYIGWIVEATKLVHASIEDLRETPEERCTNMRYPIWWVQLKLFRPWTSINSTGFFSIAEKQIDLRTVDLKKLKVRDLKKVLNDWDESCDGCLEKSDYILRIEELKPKYYKEEL